MRMYHSKVKKSEKKTLAEYDQLSRKAAFDFKALRELQVMRKAMVEDLIVDSNLTKKLNKPNRFQAQSEWIEQLFGLRELQGEGNIWLNRLESGEIQELLVIPKPHLNLKGDGQDPFELLGFQIVIGALRKEVDKQDMIMWKYANPRAYDTTLEHMRGLSPLQAIMVNIQGMNEADVNIATANKNGGASGLLYRTDLLQGPTAEQATSMRSQVNDAVNNSAMANKVAILGGEWGYINFARTVAEQKLIEQYGISFQRIANAFKTPHQIFGFGNDTYENQKQYSRSWIYGKIAPNMYQLRGLLNDRLLPEFDLDPETNLIDCDVQSLPEMTQDLKEQAEGLKDVWGMSIDDRLQYFGFEPIGGEEGNLRLVPTGLQSLKDMTMPQGQPLDNEEDLLNDAS